MIRGALIVMCSVVLWGAAGCVGCPGRGETALTHVDSGPVDMTYDRPRPEPPPVLATPPTRPRKSSRQTSTRVIEVIGEPGDAAPPARPDDVLSQITKSASPPMIPSAFPAEDLTMRLREKMAEAYGGDMKRAPKASIYLSNGTLKEFIGFYEDRGYKVTRVAVPVTRILKPVLRDRPELAGRIRLEDYEGVSVHQVMIEGTGISAADRYIDPETYEVVDRLFVTEMPVK